MSQAILKPCWESMLHAMVSISSVASNDPRVDCRILVAAMLDIVKGNNATTITIAEIHIEVFRFLSCSFIIKHNPDNIVIDKIKIHLKKVSSTGDVRV